MKEDSILKKWWIKYLIPIPSLVPVLYIQGIAYYQGTLSPYQLSDSLYPLSFEQALLHAFYFYLNTPMYIFYFAIGLTIFFFPLCFVGEALENRLNSAIPIIQKLAIFVLKISGFIKKYKDLFIIPGVLLVIAYFIYALTIIAVIPYLFAKHETLKKAKQAFATMGAKLGDELVFEKKATIKLFYNGTIHEYKGIIIKRSEKMISFLDKNEISTYPMNNVLSIKYSLKNEE